MLGLNLLFAGFIHYFIVDKFKEESKNYKNNKIEILNLQKKLANSIIQEKDLEEVKNDLKILNSVFITKDKIITLIKDIEDKAQKNKVAVEITKAEVEKMPQNSDLNLNLQFTGWGDFKNIYLFLKDLSTINYYFQFEKISITILKENELFNKKTGFSLPYGSVNIIGEIKIIAK